MPDNSLKGFEYDAVRAASDILSKISVSKYGYDLTLLGLDADYFSHNNVPAPSRTNFTEWGNKPGMFYYDLGNSSFLLKEESLRDFVDQMASGEVPSSPVAGSDFYSEVFKPNALQEALKERFSYGNINNIQSIINERKTDTKIPKLTSGLYQLIGKGLKTIGNIADYIGGGSGTLNSAGTSGINAMSDRIASALPGAAGMYAQAAIAANKIANNTYNKIDEYDGLSMATQIFGSNALGILGANRWGSKRMDTYALDDTIKAQSYGSYSGALNDISKAEDLSGKRIGTFDVRSKSKQFNKGRQFGDTLTGIISDALDRFSIADSMAAYPKREIDSYGYWQPSARMGRLGMILEKKTINLLEKLNEDNPLDPFTMYLNSLPPELRDTKNYRVKDYWELNGKPKNFLEAISKGMFTLESDGWHAKSIAYNEVTDEYEFMKSANHPTIQKEIDWYNSDDGTEFRNQYELLKTEPYWKYVRRKGTDSPQSLKEGGNISFLNLVVEIDINNLSQEFKEFTIKEIKLDNVLPEFKEGGKVNVIPEGALHARLHHMDIDGITTKGIPVVSEGEGGELEQLAEIERNEIILRLEVTKKLEELAKDGSDEAAIEAGKLLTYELLENTIDNTGLLNEIL